MKGQQYQKQHSKGKDLRHDPHHGWPPLFMLKNTKHKMQKWKGMASSFIGAIRRLCHYAASFPWWTMQQHSSIYYWPLTKMHFAIEKLHSSTKHKTTYEKQKNQLLLKMALTRVQEKTRELGGAGTFVDEILSMLGILKFLWVPVI